MLHDVVGGKMKRIVHFLSGRECFEGQALEKGLACYACASLSIERKSCLKLEVEGMTIDKDNGNIILQR